VYGVVSLLDERHNALIEDLWSEFRAQFGVHGVHLTPIAHFSYHVAPGYDIERLHGKMEEIAAQSRPFTVRTSGLGLFTGDIPVLYVGVVRTKALMQLHSLVYNAADPVSRDSLPYYRAETWVPHITLAQHDIDHELLPEVVGLLSRRDFTWEMTIDNVSLLGGDRVHSLHWRVPFKA
jgi:2'-5' RNA ligase